MCYECRMVAASNHPRDGLPWFVVFSDIHRLASAYLPRF